MHVLETELLYCLLRPHVGLLRERVTKGNVIEKFKTIQLCSEKSRENLAFPEVQEGQTNIFEGKTIQL